MKILKIGCKLMRIISSIHPGFCAFHRQRYRIKNLNAISVPKSEKSAHYLFLIRTLSMIKNFGYSQERHSTPFEVQQILFPRLVLREIIFGNIVFGSIIHRLHKK